MTRSRHLHLQFEFLIVDADVEKTEEKSTHGYQHQHMVESGWWSGGKLLISTHSESHNKSSEIKLHLTGLSCLQEQIGSNNQL